MTKNLTDKQKEALNVIKKYIASNSASPTLEELRPLLGVSSNQAVLNYLDKLEEYGYITREKGARGIRINTIHTYTNPFLKALEEGADRREVKHFTPKEDPDHKQNTSRFLQGTIDNATVGTSEEEKTGTYLSFSIDL